MDGGNAPKPIAREEDCQKEAFVFLSTPFFSFENLDLFWDKLRLVQLTGQKQSQFTKGWIRKRIRSTASH